MLKFQGPELPFPIGNAALVEDKMGGVTLFGGQKSKKEKLRTILRLRQYNSPVAWFEMKQSLGDLKSAVTAFLVPSKYAFCEHVGNLFH